MRRRRHYDVKDVLEEEYRRQLRQLSEELVRVTAQRDELRRVMGDVRRYTREEVNRATTDAIQRVVEKLNTDARLRPPRDTGHLLPSGPVHLAAHLQDPGDPSHTG